MKSLNATIMSISLAVFTSYAAMANDGGSTFRMVCSSCHVSGAYGAPVLEDKADWKPRLAKGMDALYAPLINGKCRVFVKDLRKDLTDDNIRAAIDYMVARVQ